MEDYNEVPFKEMLGKKIEKNNSERGDIGGTKPIKELYRTVYTGSSTVMGGPYMKEPVMEIHHTQTNDQGVNQKTMKADYETGRTASKKFKNWGNELRQEGETPRANLYEDHADWLKSTFGDDAVYDDRGNTGIKTLYHKGRIEDSQQEDIAENLQNEKTEHDEKSIRDMIAEKNITGFAKGGDDWNESFGITTIKDPNGGDPEVVTSEGVKSPMMSAAKDTIDHYKDRAESEGFMEESEEDAAFDRAIGDSVTYDNGRSYRYGSSPESKIRGAANEYIERTPVPEKLDPDTAMKMLERVNDFYTTNAYHSDEGWDELTPRQHEIVASLLRNLGYDNIVDALTWDKRHENTSSKFKERGDLVPSPFNTEETGGYIHETPNDMIDRRRKREHELDGGAERDRKGKIKSDEDSIDYDEMYMNDPESL